MWDHITHFPFGLPIHEISPNTVTLGIDCEPEFVHHNAMFPQRMSIGNDITLTKFQTIAVTSCFSTQSRERQEELLSYTNIVRSGECPTVQNPSYGTVTTTTIIRPSAPPQSALSTEETVITAGEAVPPMGSSGVTNP